MAIFRRLRADVQAIIGRAQASSCTVVWPPFETARPRPALCQPPLSRHSIYCQISSSGTTWHQFIQCKRGLNTAAGDTDFIDSLQGAWRDFLRVDETPFVRDHDVLVIATSAPAPPANQAAKRLCELSRASVDLQDFLLKLESKLFDRRHKATWTAFKTASQVSLGDKFTEELVFELLQHLRVDIHDLANDSSQALSLVQALLTSGQPGDSGEAVWDGLFAYVQEHGISVGTVT